MRKGVIQYKGKTGTAKKEEKQLQGTFKEKGELKKRGMGNDYM